MHIEANENAAIEGGAPIPAVQKTPKASLQNLTPLDCAQFLTAFCRVKYFEGNLDLFECLERYFIRNIDRASGETLVTMFISHAAWAQHMIE